MKLALEKTDKSSEESYITSIFDAVENKPLWELGTNQMRQIFQIAKLIQMLENAASLVLKMFQGAFDERATPPSFVLSGAYSPPIFISNRREKKAGSIFGALKTPSPNEVLLFFFEVNFVNKLRIKKNWP